VATSLQELQLPPGIKLSRIQQARGHLDAPRKIRSYEEARDLRRVGRGAESSPQFISRHSASNRQFLRRDRSRKIMDIGYSLEKGQVGK
jgi:hypothetical protein